MANKKMRFEKWGRMVEIAVLQYDGQTWIDLIKPRNKEQLATVTVNFPYELPPNHVAIKDYSENSGVLDFLIEAGIVEQPSYQIQSGFVLIPVCKLLVEPTVLD